MNKQQIKEQICDISYKLWQLGWVAANDGNITVKTEENTLIVTPTGVSKSMITPDMLIEIDLNGNLLAASGAGKPSSEVKMHLKCYELREDAGAVVHAHPPTATGFALANRPLDFYTMPEAIIALGSVPVTPYATPSTEEVPNSIAPFLPMHDALLLGNHGALTIGADLITAYYRMETLELFAKTSLNAILLGGADDLPRGDIDKLIDLRTNYYKVTGRHPGYKKYS